jgi:hypothetical protein
VNTSAASTHHHIIYGLLASVCFRSKPSQANTSLVLDPRISYEGLKQDYESDPTLLQSLDEAKDDLYTEYTTHYAKNPSQASQDDTTASTAGPSSPSKFDFLGCYKRTCVSSTSQIKRELDKYFEMTAEPEDMETCDILKWWKNWESTFPNLYNLVRDIHCIPGALMNSPSATDTDCFFSLEQALPSRWRGSFQVGET